MNFNVLLSIKQQFARTLPLQGLSPFLSHGRLDQNLSWIVHCDS